MVTGTRYRLFVYGTLRPGLANYKALCEGRVRVTVPALVRGMLYDLPAGYPALLRGDNWIRGDVLCFDDEHLMAELDDLEDFKPGREPDKNLYLREPISIYDLNKRLLTSVQTYRMTLATAQSLGGLPYPGSDWKPLTWN